MSNTNDNNTNNSSTPDPKTGGANVHALKSTDVEGVLAEMRAMGGTGGGIFILPSNFGKKPKAATAKKAAKKDKP